MDFYLRTLRFLRRIEADGTLSLTMEDIRGSLPFEDVSISNIDCDITIIYKAHKIILINNDGRVKVLKDRGGKIFTPIENYEKLKFR